MLIRVFQTKLKYAFCVSVCLSVCLYVCLSVSLSVYLIISLSLSLSLPDLELHCLHMAYTALGIDFSFELFKAMNRFSYYMLLMGLYNDAHIHIHAVQS